LDQVNLADDTANEWYITGVQLEAGTTASDFEFLPVDVNLARCQRYCQELAPKVNDCRIAIGSSISLDSSSSISGNLVCNVATTPFTGGQAGQFITNGTSSSILASAEL
jgi:hypothetical protein